MNIVLDTNIFVQDFLMTSRKFKILFDYLKKTNSKIIIPEIVYKEIAAVYKRELTEKSLKFIKAKETLGRSLVDASVPDYMIDVTDEVRKYLIFLKNKLGISDTDIFPYKDIYLKNALDRAIQYIKPCSESREEFCDTILWLTILDIAGTTNEKELVFISNNIKDFASDSRHLHPTLVRDAEDKGLTIRYYSSLNDFNEDLGIESISFAKYLVLDENIKAVNDEVIDVLQHEKHRLLEWVGQKGHKPIGYVFVTSASMEFRNLSAYEMVDGSWEVNAEYDGKVEVEFELEQQIIKESFEHGYDYDFAKDKFGSHPIYRSSSESKTFRRTLYPEIEILIIITIDKGKIQLLELDAWFFK